MGKVIYKMCLRNKTSHKTNSFTRSLRTRTFLGPSSSFSAGDHCAVLSCDFPAPYLVVPPVFVFLNQRLVCCGWQRLAGPSPGWSPGHMLVSATAQTSHTRSLCCKDFIAPLSVPSSPVNVGGAASVPCSPVSPRELGSSAWRSCLSSGRLFLGTL